MPLFTVSFVGPYNQLVFSFGYFEFCVPALAQPSAHIMNSMCALEEALDILPFSHR